ncbi:hypothetical protein HDU98_001923 [Podochytrium sp. JEL0797]|nr:hypothetical protein HDU98_001923 [Podochytrium sp. JEL0797]
MDQFDWLGGSSSSSGNGGYGNSNGGNGSSSDDWLHLSHLMLEGLDDESLDLDDAALQRNEQNNSAASLDKGKAAALLDTQPQQQAQFGSLSVAQMAVATQQAILASSLLANHQFMAAANLNPLQIFAQPTPQLPLPLPLPIQLQQQQQQQQPVDPKPAKTNKTESELDKRKRNTAASARFRAKKKMKQEFMEQTTKQLTDKVEALERRLQEYEMEIQMLRQEIDGSDDKKTLADIYDEHGIAFHEGIAAAGQGIERNFNSQHGGSSSNSHNLSVFNSDSDSLKAESLTDLMGLESPTPLQSRQPKPAPPQLQSRQQHAPPPQLQQHAPPPQLQQQQSVQYQQQPLLNHLQQQPDHYQQLHHPLSNGQHQMQQQQQQFQYERLQPQHPQLHPNYPPQPQHNSLARGDLSALAAASAAVAAGYAVDMRDFNDPQYVPNPDPAAGGGGGGSSSTKRSAPVQGSGSSAKRQYKK